MAGSAPRPACHRFVGKGRYGSSITPVDNLVHGTAQVASAQESTLRGSHLSSPRARHAHESCQRQTLSTSRHHFVRQAYRAAPESMKPDWRIGTAKMDSVCTVDHLRHHWVMVLLRAHAPRTGGHSHA